MNRMASSCIAVAASTPCRPALLLPRRPLRHRPPSHNHRCISITPPLSLPLPARKTSPEEPKTAQKKVNKEKKGPSSAKLEKIDSAEKRMTDLLIKAYDAPSLVPPPANAEEMARRYDVGRNYVIGSFRRHNEMNHDLAVKIRMKRYALRMMPREGIDLGDVAGGGGGRSAYGRWKEEALKVNDNWGPPDHRHIPMYTPPIPGFDIGQYMNKGDEDN